MIKPKIPNNEVERLHALRALQILDTLHEERFDRVTRMAKRIFGVAISLVSLVEAERQWFKSSQGLDVSETSRDVSFCAHAINQESLFIIPDAVLDERFCDNPLVVDNPKIRFYAGYPLKIRQGVNIGTLCLIDSKPREMSEDDKLLLEDLGKMIEQEIKSIQLATLDELTMISNRRGFLTLADYSMKICRRNELTMSFIILDLNKFKAINDTYGHHEGDFALATFAQLMLQSFRESDVIARLGGDEFVILLADCYMTDAHKVLQEFKNVVNDTNKILNKPFSIEFSAGIAQFPHDTDKSIEEMIQEADAAMYQDKKSET